MSQEYKHGFDGEFNTVKFQEQMHTYGWNQTVLADKVGVTASCISAIKNGRARPSAELLHAMSAKLGCKPTDLWIYPKEKVETIDADNITDNRQIVIDALRIIKSVCAEHILEDCEGCPLYKGRDCVVTSIAPADWQVTDHPNWQAFD